MKKTHLAFIVVVVVAAVAYYFWSRSGSGAVAIDLVDKAQTAEFRPAEKKAEMFKVAPQTPHGAVVLSHDGAQGQVWLDRHQRPRWINAFTVVGLPLARHGDVQ